MRLSAFIRDQRPVIIAHWEAFAGGLAAAEGMSTLQLRDHIDDILSFIADDIETLQTPRQQQRKSVGLPADVAVAGDTAAQIHSDHRHSEGYNIVEMVSEYRALRASVISLWGAQRGNLNEVDLLDLTRFNEAIDQALAESVVRFSQRVDASKDLLLGVLGHDIRSPLGAIQMSAQILPRLGPLSEKQVLVVEQIVTSADRVRTIVTDLLDMARARLGTGLPVKLASMSLTALLTRIVDEFHVLHPLRPITLDFHRDFTGLWDETRLGQLFSNLLGNAIQYGSPAAAISLMVREEGTSVCVLVHNQGPPIPRKHLATVFQSFTRGPETVNDGAVASTNLGLGLYIAKEVVTAHDGQIDVVSDANGTTFTVKLPL